MSIFNDFFERFRRRYEPRFPNMDIPQDILNDLYNESFGEGESNESTYPGGHDTFFHSPMDFMSHFEEMFNNFFKGFPVMAFPPPEEHKLPSLPENETTYDNNSTLQDRMLNDKHNRRSIPQFPFSADGSRRPYGRFNGPPVTREDRNLDEELKAGDKSLDDILPRGNTQPGPTHSFGSFSSSSLTRDSNGIVESKKTVRDSRGNEEVTIKRRVDGKEYTVTHKTDEHGNKETNENVVELGTESKRPYLLTPESSPITTPSLYGRLRSWLFNED